MPPRSTFRRICPVVAAAGLAWLSLATCSPAGDPGKDPDLNGRRSQTDLLRLESVHGAGDVQGLAVSADQSRAYLGEGAQISILDLANLLPPVSGAEPWDHPAVIAKVPVDATVMDLMLLDTAADNDAAGDGALLIAGGSFGLLKLDTSGTGSGCGCGELGVVSGCFPVTVLDDADRTQPSPAGKNEKWCCDLELTSVAGTDYVLALFAAQEDSGAAVFSELRVYLRGSLVHVQTVDLVTTQGGRAYSVAADGAYVYVGMGTAGIWEADLAALPITWTQRMVFDPSSLPSGIPSAPIGLTITPAENGRVMDLELHAGVLYAAVDSWGLIAIDPGTWTATDNIELQEPGGGRTYATHLDVQTIPGGSTLVFCGGSGCGLGVGGNAPFSNYGRMAYDLGVGGEVADCATSIEAMYVFEVGSSLVLDSYKSGVGTAGGSFVVLPAGANLRVYEQPAHYFPALLSGFPAGLKVFTFTPASSPPAPFSPIFDYAYAGRGRSVFGAFTSLINPSLLIETMEVASGCAFDSQYYDISDPACPTELTSPALPGVSAIWPPDARWIDPSAPTQEWFVTQFYRNIASGGDYGWKVNRMTSGTPCSLDDWDLSRPLTPDCVLGRSAYAMSAVYTDAVDGTPNILAMRSENPWGAVIYDRQRVQDVAATQAPGCYVFNHGTCADPDHCSTSSQDSLATYRAQVLTHPETWVLGNVPKPSTYDAKVFEAVLPGGSVAHSVAVFAAGFNVDPLDANFTRAAIALADLSETPTNVAPCSSCPKDTPTLLPLAVAYSPFDHGNAMAVEVGTICGRRYAFVADFGGRILLFDIEDPTNPQYVSAWVLPLNTLDGHYDNVVDLLLDFPEENGDEYRVYFSSLRPGLGRLRLTVDCAGPLPSISFPATSSWLDADVFKRDTPGLSHLMSRRDVGGNLGLLLGDKNCGFRLYGDWATGSSPDCH